MENQIETVTLEIGRDMTHTKLIEWLEERFAKNSSKPFTAQDVYGYIKRGTLPYHFGLYKIEEIEYPEIGLKIVRITDHN